MQSIEFPKYRFYLIGTGSGQTSFLEIKKVNNQPTDQNNHPLSWNVNEKDNKKKSITHW